MAGLGVVILAAGKGTRMKSNQPKVLHKLAGKSLLTNVLLTAENLTPEIITIVHGHKGEEVKSSIKSELTLINNASYFDSLDWVEQREQLGTGHALITALKELSDKLDATGVDRVLVLCGDVPLVNLQDLTKLISTIENDQLGMLTLKASNPYGLGRIVRDQEGNINSIVEEKDASNKQKLISEVNTGIFLFPYPRIKEWLSSLSTDNTQQEYYLTDVVDMAVREGIKVHSITVSEQNSYMGINNLYQLAQAERHYQYLYAIGLLEQGVKIIDPARIDVRGNLRSEKDVHIDINCLFEGDVTIGTNTIIEPNCIIRNSTIGFNVIIKANSVIEDSVIGNNCKIGPFARLRPETQLQNNVQIGNFVEVKKSKISDGSKVNHLSYVGDAIIGRNVNVGAGTITCNYDGVNKHVTTINDGAFIGSNTSLVAPVTIGEAAVIGAGTTVIKDAPAQKLTLARSKQITVDGWVRKEKAS